MSSFEMLQCKVISLERRLAQLESRERLSRVNGVDAAEAEALAMKLSIDPDVFIDPIKVNERHKLARELHKKGWTVPRIAKVMGCVEKTAARWLGVWGTEN